MLNRGLLYTHSPAKQIIMIIMTINALRISSVFVHMNAYQTAFL